MAEYLFEPLPSHASLFSDEQWLAALLAYESALAHAQAECGLIPPSAAQEIDRACATVKLDRTAFVEQARKTGAVGLALTKPLQQQLASIALDALPWLHWGTTTQDAVDTAHALLTRDAAAALDEELGALSTTLETLAAQHASTPMLARSLLQPAQITSFGLKCAQIAAALRRSQKQLKAVGARALCVQLGGAVGNRAALGEHGDQVEQALARRLGLAVAGHAWHTQRDEWMRLGMEVAVCCGSLAKLAKDWALMSQFEVGEVSEASRGSTSSAMPHKRNPVHCMQAIAQSQTVPHIASFLLSCMPQAHERALGEWQSEVAHWASLWMQTISTCRSLNLAAQGLQINTKRMQANVDALHELIFSEAFTQALKGFVSSEAAAKLVAGQSDIALATAQPLGALLQIAVEPLCPPADLEKARAAIAHAADLQQAVVASARACGELLQQASQAAHSL